MRIDYRSTINTIPKGAYTFESKTFEANSPEYFS